MIHLISLKNASIFEQLKIEEALLRADTRNFCLINQGSPRAIVMGISGKPEHVLNVEAVHKDNIPLIQRCSGGGTVIVDEHTLFVSFIFNKDFFPTLAFPEPILRWSAELYQAAWKIPGFALRENDFAIHDQKCGGNAQYLQKQRWLHHTTFLWDYKEANMQYLLHPPKQPVYRKSRSHTDFLCRLKNYSLSMEILVQQLVNHLGNVKPLYIVEENVKDWKFSTHRCSTILF